MKGRNLLLSFLSAVLLILSFPNVNLEFLAWFALVPLFYSIREESILSSFYLGFITGLTSFLGIIYWIVVAVHTYGNVPLSLSILILLLLVLYLSLYIGMFTMLTRLVQLRLGSRMILLAPFLWVGLEYLRSFFLTGFPWAELGHSQYLNLPFVQIADITGVYGLSFVIVFINAVFYLVLDQWPRKRFPYREVLIASVVLTSVLVYGYSQIGTVDQKIRKEKALRVRLVQGNIDQSVKWSESYQRDTVRIYERLSLQQAKEKPDFIIWPETAAPFFFQDAKEYQPLILDVPVKANAFLLFGSPSYKIENRKANHYNSAYLVSPSGEIAGRYDKIHLVPFGEYVPLGEILKLGSLGEGIGNFKSGREIINLSLPQARFGVLICFEIIFPDLCRKFVKKGANFLVTITNDAWFGRTAAPYQHLAIATFRAVENRVYIARAANTGISGFIDPTGKIVRKGGLFKEETINGVIHLSETRTFYTLYGDVFAWICSGISILLVGYGLLRKRR
jgi:apolipoprotein N-acyltransferase